MYQCFKQARRAAYQTLIDCEINSLPVNLSKISKHYGIKMVSYSHCSFFRFLHPDVVSSDGFITQIDDIKIIFVNDVKADNRRRFTIGHELGHALLGHPLDVIHTRHVEHDDPSKPVEMQANLFSRNIIAPLCVLYEMGIVHVHEIMSVCDLSHISAVMLSRRLQALHERSAMRYTSLEQQVLKQFSGYIVEYKKKNPPGADTPNGLKEKIPSGNSSKLL